MPNHTMFLVIDDNPDSRFLLVKTLLRKFPCSIVHECRDSTAALLVVRTTPHLAAIVAHRTADVEGLALLPLLRRVNPTVPIVYVSGVDRAVAALAAGATRYLNFDEWLRIGTVVSDLLPPSRDARSGGQTDVSPPQPSVRAT